ncbi:hypothetical protein BDQ12DRAFT_738606 [Crucibulum laeve]|uniref:Zn(2)-C6 fungal-type domain-containing protein n=1 Tax=Crucibulum laeve TaxID=68775 RepID=A0A5C3LKY4_9AGAR|nr:hypothetical protein BDQ12DRAFT_738606 [Crucibulum laeve]
MSYSDSHHGSHGYDDMSSAMHLGRFNDFYSQRGYVQQQPHPERFGLDDTQPEEYASHSLHPIPIPSRQESLHLDSAGTHNSAVEQQYLFNVDSHPRYSASSSMYDHNIPQPTSPHNISPQSWPSYDHAVPPASFLPSSPLNPWGGSYPTPAPYPPPRLSPPAVSHPSGALQHSASRRLTLAGSLDPETGIFYRTPEHPRLRTAQACEKCRARKAKCTGECPCGRCASRGLVCEYAKEGRVRGPNKPKPKGSSIEESRNLTRRRSPSAPRISQPRENPVGLSFADDEKREHRSNRPRPPNLELDSSSNLTRLEGPHSADAMWGGGRGMRQNEEDQARSLKPPTIRPLGWPGPASKRDQDPSSLSIGYKMLPNLQANLSMPSMSPSDANHSFDHMSAFSSSNPLGHGHAHNQGLSLSEAAYFQQHQRLGDDNRGHGSDAGSLSNPQSAVSMTFNSPHISSVESPPTPASSMAHFSREGEHLDQFALSLPPDLDPQAHRDLHTAGAQALDPVWADLRSNTEFDSGHAEVRNRQYRSSPEEKNNGGTEHTAVGDSYSTVGQLSAISHASPNALNGYSLL